MQVKITALTQQSAVIPFNYNYALHSAIYALIEKSSSEYSRYLHDRGFINETKNKRFKLLLIPSLLELAMMRVLGMVVVWGLGVWKLLIIQIITKKTSKLIH